MAGLHELVGRHLGEDADGAGGVGIETDRGPWVAALVAAGYTVFGVNPLQASRYRERHGVSGAKSDSGDAHILADMVRTDSHQLRAVAATAPGRSQGARPHAQDADLGADPAGAAVRHQLREYFPAALRPSTTWTPPTRWSCWARHPSRPGREADPRAGQRRPQARRPPEHHGQATAILAALRGEQLGQPPAVTAAYAVTVRSLIAVIAALNVQVKILQGQVEADLAGTRTLRSTGPSPASAPSSVPGCSASSATTRTGTPTASAGGTTPGPALSPARRGRKRSSPPGSSTTTGSSTRSTPRPSRP